MPQSRSALADFLAAYRRFLHATELNGYRRHAEDKSVIQLGREWDLPRQGEFGVSQDAWSPRPRRL